MPPFFRFGCKRVGKFNPGAECSAVRIAYSLPFWPSQAAVRYLIHSV